MLLIVENEACQHVLPSIPNTVAVLGCGLDLHWTCGSWLQERRVAYWGDMDSWGLKALGIARSNIPTINALLMSKEVWELHRNRRVSEPVNAGTEIPIGLLANEAELYAELVALDRGRLEQEYLPESIVRQAIVQWGMNIETFEETP